VLRSLCLSISFLIVPSHALIVSTCVSTCVSFPPVYLACVLLLVRGLVVFVPVRFLSLSLLFLSGSQTVVLLSEQLKETFLFLKERLCLLRLGPNLAPYTTPGPGLRSSSWVQDQDSGPAPGPSRLVWAVHSSDL